MAELLYPELSYRLVGLLYKIYNRLGGGYQEKVYQEALRRELLINQIGFLEQVKVDLFYDKQKLQRYYIDFIADHKIVIELKVTPRFTHRDIMQVLTYLKQSNLKLGILASLNRDNIQFKRILRGLD